MQRCTKVPTFTPVRAEVLESQKRRFREKFGRDLAPADPIFFRPDSIVPAPHLVSSVKTKTPTNLNTWGLDPAFIYALLKTGIIPTNTSSEEDLQKFEEALGEYHKVT